MKLFGRPSNRARSASRGVGQKPSPRYYRAPADSPVSNPFKRQPASKGPKISLLKRLRNLLLVISFVAGAIYSSLVKPQPAVTISNTSYHGAQTYQTAAQTALKTLRNRTKLTLDEKGITTSLKRQFPEIDRVIFRVPLINQTLKINLEVAAPTFTLHSGDDKYIVGANGVVVSASGQLPAMPNLPILIDQSGFSVSPGQRVIGTEAVSFINSLLAQCQKAGVKVSSLTLPPSPQALELRTEGSPYFVKFDLGGDAALQAGQYLAAKHKFDSEGSQPNEYLDVRVAGKIYYR